MHSVINIYKPVGITPLELIEVFKEKYPQYEHEKIAYAGRLDPMAEGVMILLIGEECKKRKEYELMPKTYVFEILFGAATDTYDILGLVQNTTSSVQPQINIDNLSTVSKSFVGTRHQAYPPYSSARVNGKPLFWWAREGKLDEITIPSKTITINSLICTSSSIILGEEVKQEILHKISKVKGDFRQEKIRQSWESFFANNSEKSFTMAKFACECSSGSYMRSLANDIGKRLGFDSLAYSIKRTKVGDFRLEDSLNLPGGWDLHPSS